MRCRFERDASVADGLRRIVRERLDRAVAEADRAAGAGDANDDGLAEAVHEVRKRGKTEVG